MRVEHDPFMSPRSYKTSRPLSVLRYGCVGLLSIAGVSTAYAADKSDAVALPALRAVVLQPTGDTGQQTGQQPLSAEGLNLTQAPSLYKIIQPFIGKPLTFQKMHELTGAIAIFFREHDRAFMSINVPPQRVHAGVLHLDVTEYRLGHISVHGNNWTPAWQIRRDSGLTPGQTMALTALQTDLDWLNLNPFHTVDMVYRPSDKPGMTDVDLHVSDRFPVYAYAAINNQADRTLGRLNWYVGASWGNAFGLGHIVTYQFNRTMMGRFNNHSASWTIPLTSRNALQVFGNYAISVPTSNDQQINNRGGGQQLSIRWLHMINHITLTKYLGIDGTFQIGYDWKRSSSFEYYKDLDIPPRSSARADVNQFVFGYNGSLQDPWGQTQINNQFFYGPGGFTALDSRQHYKDIFPSASPNYVYDRLALTRNQSLPYGLSSTTRVTFQRASKNLLYSEQLMIGGLGNARGYFANTSFGSNGNSFSEEIYLPSFSLGKIVSVPQIEDTHKVGFFWDWADNRQVKHTGNGARAATLSSLGVDLNSALNRYLNVTFDAGYRLRRIHTNSLANRRGLFTDFQVVAGF